jgi:hypothetical protein
MFDLRQLPGLIEERLFRPIEAEEDPFRVKDGSATLANQ